MRPPHSCGSTARLPERLLVLRLLAFLGLAAIAVSVVIFLFTRDLRYLRFAWQLFKFTLVLMLVFAALMMMGRLILY